jgi:hypothetical protein
MSKNVDLEKNRRLVAIRNMYQYQAKVIDHEVIPHTMEKIDNWYVDGIRTVERLAELFDIERIYDSNAIDLKIFLKDKL